MLRVDEAPALDVEAAVLRRVRMLPRPRGFAPLISFPQFAAASVSALLLLGAAAAVLVAALAPEPAVRDGKGAFVTVLSTSLAAAASILRSMIRRGLDLAGSLSEGAGWLQLPLTVFWQTSILACVAALALALLVATHEARGRRLAG